jgi:hypothetical protein
MARILTAGREDMPTYSSMTQPWDQDHCFWRMLHTCRMMVFVGPLSTTAKKLSH